MGPVLRLAAREYAALWPMLLWTTALVFVVLDPVNGALWFVAEDRVSAPVTTLISIAGSYYYEGVVALLVRHRRAQGSRPSLRRLFKRVPTLRLAAVDVILLLPGTVGLALGVAPGLVLLTIWFVAGPVVVIERSGVLEAFRRSRDLVRGSFRPVFLLVLLALPLYGAVVLGFGWLGVVLVGENVWGYFLGAFLGNLAFAPLASLTVVVTYFELRRIESGRIAPVR